MIEKTSDKPETRLTPLMKQYWEVKSAHPDKVLLFRMGDFFEIFHDDAVVAAPILGIALTKRNQKSADETPMCGVPHHSIGQYINKLLAAGKKVAICDQIEDPKFAKGIVKRAVTRILSPGMVYDTNTLDGYQPNYIATVADESLAVVDVSTGEAFYYRVTDLKMMRQLLQVLSPSELILSSEQDDLETSLELASVHKTRFELEEGSLDLPKSCRRLFAYIRYMQSVDPMKILRPFEERSLTQRLELGQNVIRHLEIFETYRGDHRGSLFQSINRTLTPGGARLLRNWLAFPLASLSQISDRQSELGFWLKDSEKHKEVRSLLRELGDLERRCSRVSQPTCNGRDLNALCQSLDTAQKISQLLGWAVPSQIMGVCHNISSTIVDEPPVGVRDGHLIRDGISAELDELVRLSTDGQSLLLQMEAEEKEKTGISSLKIKYNNVFGYSIEVTHTHKAKVPTHYRRRQTLTQAERYTTDELEKLETRILTARTKRLEIEYEIFETLRQKVITQISPILELAQKMSRIDVTSGLAWLAIESNYTAPKFVTDQTLKIMASRHPVVERLVSKPFVANDIEIGLGCCMLLTGPNMAGKSTLMRQVALTVILAQIGSYVPASSAELPIFEKVFTRIGANDFLSEGLSTFMVEMKETAELLEMADPKSLVILDEVGRGTSTFDGMSLAQSILEYIVTSVKATTLFATHYHELTALDGCFPQIFNAHMGIRERAGVLSFLYTLQEGPANQSYGIHVAELAGLPSLVVQRAQKILEEVETRQVQGQSQLSLFAKSPQKNETLVTPRGINEIYSELGSLSVESTTPLEALQILARWQSTIDQ